MLVKESMTANVQYVPTGTSLTEAAVRMVELDCGFLPISDSDEGRLVGVITDRDIAIRAVAEGQDPNVTTVDQVKTNKVLYCYQDDDMETAANSMRDQHVYRLVVLNNDEDKQLCGVISLGDIVRQDEKGLAGRAAKGITA